VTSGSMRRDNGPSMTRGGRRIARGLAPPPAAPVSCLLRGAPAGDSPRGR
jgi:hypothetical protein